MLRFFPLHNLLQIGIFRSDSRPFRSPLCVFIVFLVNNLRLKLVINIPDQTKLFTENYQDTIFDIFELKKTYCKIWKDGCIFNCSSTIESGRCQFIRYHRFLWNSHQRVLSWWKLDLQFYFSILGFLGPSTGGFQIDP